MTRLESAERPAIRLVFTNRPLIEEPILDPKLADVLSLSKNCPATLRPSATRAIRAIDHQELPFDDAAKLLVIHFWWENSDNVWERLRKVFGEDVEAKLELRFTDHTMEEIQREYFDRLNYPYLKVLQKLNYKHLP